MSVEIEAIYERGILKLSRELPLEDGQKVTITIYATGSAVERVYGIVRWQGDAEEFHRVMSDPDEGQWGDRDL